MRIKKAFSNALFGISGMAIHTLLAFALRTVFIHSLGVAYLGVNGLMTSILSMLSMAELGVGSAITFSMYQPLATNDTEKINALMTFYRKVYMFVGLFILVAGSILVPFIPYLVKEPSGISGLKAIYFLFLLNTSFTYFMAFKRTLIIADQRGYLIVPFKTAFYALTVGFQIAVLVFSSNYFLFLFVQLAAKLAENITVNRFIHSKYLYLDTRSKNALPKRELALIVRNVKAMFLHRIGEYAINGTDNLIISVFINVSAVGLYSNYFLLINTVKKFLSIILNGTTASFGNLIATESKEKALETFETFNFIAFCMFGWASISGLNLFSPFISLWIGEEFLLKPLVVGLLVVDFFLVGLRTPLSIVKMAAGVYQQDRYVPLAQAFVNLVFSLILVHYWGLAGVFAGTLLSSIFVVSWVRPLIVYKHVFKTSARKYFATISRYFAAYILCFVVTTFVCEFLFHAHTVMNFIGRGFVCLILPNAFIFLFFQRSSEFKASLKIARLIMKKKKKGKNG